MTKSREREFVDLIYFELLLKLDVKLLEVLFFSNFFLNLFITSSLLRLSLIVFFSSSFLSSF